MPRRRLLVWHDTLQRYIGPGERGLVITVGYETVAQEYADSYRFWARSGHWSPQKCAQEARISALCPWRYGRVARVKRLSPSERTMDVWTTHPANIPDWAIY